MCVCVVQLTQENWETVRQKETVQAACKPMTAIRNKPKAVPRQGLLGYVIWDIIVGQTTFGFIFTFTSCNSGNVSSHSITSGAEGTAQRWSTCLAGFKSYVWSPALHKLGVVQHACSLSSPEVEAKESEFKVILGYIANFRRAWITRPFLNNKQELTKVENYKSLWFKTIQNYKKFNLD